MAKGFKTGGRQKGTPNKRMSVQREAAAHQAKAEVQKAHVGGRKLAKDVLEDYMFAFNAMAARFQNNIATAINAGGKANREDLDGFKEWGMLAVETGKSLAKFQSPVFKAVAVVAAPPTGMPVDGKMPASSVEHVRDPILIARHYSEIVRLIR